MSRTVKIVSALAALGLVLAGCAEQKATGLPPSPTAEPLAANLIKVVDSAFQPPQFTVKSGDSVTWQFTGSAPHNVRFVTLKDANGKPVTSHPNCTPTGTGCATAGDVFSWKFAKPGRYLYYCVVHGTPQGGGMSGTIVVS